MLARIIFCVFVAAAVLAVVLLATVSPLPHLAGHKAAPGTRTFTVYVHPTAAVQGQDEAAVVRRGEASAALVFHHRMTAAPESTSATIGAASGFVLLPAAGERGASVFDTVHLAFNGGGAGMSGSLCVEASKKRRPGKRGRGAEDKEEVLRVVGGTGAFAFARGRVVVRGQRTGRGQTATALILEISVSGAGS